MTQRYFICLSFDGTAYHGWQIQPNGNSVQEELQRALSTLLRQSIEVVGAGRTDAGVHARMMVAHFDRTVGETDDEPLDGAQLVYKLNKLLPRDIAVRSVTRVDNDLHARFSAISRTYHYYVHECKDPFIRQYSHRLYRCPDYEMMNAAAARLLSVDDFASFCKSHHDAKTTICHLREARWEPLGEGRWRFVVTADRFLRNMVRALVGTLLDVGYGKLSLQDFDDVISSGQRTSAGESVPAQGLYLVDIGYGQPIGS